jgi:class 3 adenylate cyclase
VRARCRDDDARQDTPAVASYTPKHLAEKILTSKAALEGERKQVTVLFADLKGSMELLADRDPEDARKLLDPVLMPESNSLPRSSCFARWTCRAGSTGQRER